MRPLLSLLALVWLPSCLHIFTTHYDYQATAPAPTAAGSAFRVEFIPKATESGVALSAMVVGGALVSEVGPYQMRLHAFGQPNDQQWFEVKSMRLSGADQFEAPMEPRGFTGRAEFKPTQTPGSTRASLLLGPYVTLDAKKQHDIVLDAEVVIMRRTGLSRGPLRIPLVLTKTKRRESTNVIAEIAHDIRDRDKPTIPAGLPPPPEKP
ncbi:MAG: hypothetical protein K9N47_19355 [Prosthecobacter sp.]|uniref:hypothetical protein n=1 Tax=Prosthecobacter sp. TaxID=1965333 RepID=UPI0025D76670|nr:hypothetical protein [Prosthecobacter sp.]MCF7788289.1 hypothetical protein [Prosthecobacter sp.]